MYHNNFWLIMSDNQDPRIQAILKEQKMDDILSFIDMKGTICVSEAASFLMSGAKADFQAKITEATELLRELENKQYIENTTADFYHVTYKGHKRVQSRS
jgi:hypothetical protein